jgi:hypothetical protein
VHARHDRKPLPVRQALRGLFETLVQKADLGIDGDEPVPIELDAKLQREREAAMNGAERPYEVLGERRRGRTHERPALADPKELLLDGRPQEVIVIWRRQRRAGRLGLRDEVRQQRAREHVQDLSHGASSPTIIGRRSSSRTGTSGCCLVAR